jgi:hypothetical protein
MKLIDILARELKVWLNCYNGEETAAITQDRGGELNTLDRGYVASPGDFEGTTWSSSNWTLSGFEFEQADDYATAIVTREQWQAAVEALKGPAVDWSKAPEGYPLWIVDNEGENLSRWHQLRDGGYFDESGQRWSLRAENRGRITVYRKPDEPVAPAWTGEGLPPVGTVCEFNDGCGGGYKKVEVMYVSAMTVLVKFDGSPNEDVEGAYSPHESLYFRPIRTPEQIAAEEREAVINEMVTVINGAHAEGKTLAQAMYDAGYRKPETLDN